MSSNHALNLHRSSIKLPVALLSRTHLSGTAFKTLSLLLKHLNTEICRSRSHIATDGQSVSKSWCRAPSGAHDQIFITVWQLRSFLWGALSDNRTGLSFVYAAGLCQRSLSRVRVPYFTVSDFRLPFSSPPTTRRITVEVFDPASIRVTEICWVWVWVLCYDRQSVDQSVLV
jgi:hypothetical protein